MSDTNAWVAQRGMALISSLLLLVIVTILALSMFRSFGVEEKIAGNTREKQRALAAAESAQQYAEYWLANGNAGFGATCSALLSANLNQGQICNTPMVVNNDRTVIAGQPWPAVGVTYNAGAGGGMMTLTATAPGTANTFYSLPQFYIYDAGPSKDGQGELYQIDALGYGANSNAVAIVESTFEVSTGVVNRGGL
jgi:type IV pilus assembly protein PilX